jgi:hypothetical protein
MCCLASAEYMLLLPLLAESREERLAALSAVQARFNRATFLFVLPLRHE